MDQSNLYTCPMHPEVIQEGSDRCPKCGMALVPKGAENAQSMALLTNDKGLGTLTWRSYLPLITILLLILGASSVVSWKNGFSFPLLILYFMTGFFIVFAGFKLIDIKGFAHGYFTYDLLAQHVMSYGYVYPFIELGFGFTMLAGFMPTWLLWLEFGVMLFSGLGVAIKLAKGEQFQCVCLGTFLKVPLTKVTLIEDFGMAGLALILLLIK
jgi:heavy metal-binding protein/methylamine utilization protein MauE